MTTRRAQRKALRRQDILNTAMNLASTRGIFGLSLGDLAEAVGTSKSTLLLHFGTKEGLTLAMIDEGERIFFAEVVLPALESPPGLLRLQSLAERWIDYVPRAFDGGCVLTAMTHEFDGRPGPIKTRLAAFNARLSHVVGAIVDDAWRRGELHRPISGDEAMFQLQGITLALNMKSQMETRDGAMAQARQAATWWFLDISTPDGDVGTAARPSDTSSAQPAA